MTATKPVFFQNSGWLRLLALFFLGACGSESNSGGGYDATLAKIQASANNALAFEIYEAVSAESPDIHVCPVSLELALGSLSALSGSDQQTLLADFVDPENSKVDAGSRFKNWTGLLTSDTGATLSVGSGFWFADELTATESLPDLKPYLSTIRQTSFTSLDYLSEEINAWVDNATDSNVQNVVAPGELEQGDQFIAASGAFFDGSWAQKFNPKLTQDDVFYNDSSAPIGTASYMTQTLEAPHVDSEALDATFTRLDFASSTESSYSLVIAIPKTSIATLEQKLSTKEVASLLAELEVTEPIAISLRLPKWQTVTTLDLQEMITGLGLGQLFGDTADFSAISSDQVALAGLYHKSLFRIAEGGTNDDGTDAATEVDNEAVEVNANRPFLYALIHRGTNSVVFMGRQKTAPSIGLRKLRGK
jgi:serine protease inhibitor